MKVAIISDLHETEFGKDNSRLVTKIRNQEPDIILAVGDFINKESKNTDILISLMEQLVDVAPTFFSLGNHEMDYIENNSNKFQSDIENIGVHIMDNDFLDIEIRGETIRIGGIYKYAFSGGGVPEDEYLVSDVYTCLTEYQETDNLKIMMAHRPDSFIFDKAYENWDIDVVVSGHNHGGQIIIPFVGGLYGGDQGWFPDYVSGVHELGNMTMVITRGLGSDKQKLPRINNLPEILVLTIKPAKYINNLPLEKLLDIMGNI